MEFNIKAEVLPNLDSVFKEYIEMRSFSELLKPKIEYIYDIDDRTTVEVFNDKSIKKTIFVYDNEDKKEEDYECCYTFTEEILKPGSKEYDEIRSKLYKLTPSMIIDSNS